jgi:K+-sensing histidine kinase KdpD
VNATTFFAPAGRADSEQLSDQQQAVVQAAFISAMLQAVPDMVMILNEHRQIVAANGRLLSAIGATDPAEIVGKRLGEAVSCIHSNEGPDGCGTAEKCSACGAVMTIMSSQETGSQTVDECRIVASRDTWSALDFEVMATPLDVAGIPLTIFALRDISSEKRRQVLEHTFFHDILNTVGGIKGIAELLATSDTLTPETEIEYKGWMVDLSNNMAEEINQQRRLLAAERGEYVPKMKEIDVKELLQEVCRLYGNHVRTPYRTVVLEDIPQCRLTSDSPMLRRIVGNMVLNALEATSVGGMVRVAVENSSDKIRIRVINQGEIPHEVRLRIFKRSFSTKASSGRGIGTYCMKLFGERYLGGKVDFICSNGETEFFVELARIC